MGLEMTWKKSEQTNVAYCHRNRYGLVDFVVWTMEASVWFFLSYFKIQINLVSKIPSDGYLIKYTNFSGFAQSILLLRITNVYIPIAQTPVCRYNEDFVN